MFDFIGQRKKILNQYKELTKKLPQKFMNIHFKSINIKNKKSNDHILPNEIFKSKDNKNIQIFMDILDPEIKGLILNKKNQISSLFHTYSSSFDKYNNKKIKKNKLLNKQTIILAKYNIINKENTSNNNNNSKTKNDIIFHKKDVDEVFGKNKNKYNNSYNGMIYRNNTRNKYLKDKENISKEEILKINKGKALSQTFFGEINKMNNKKKLELITDEKNNVGRNEKINNNLIYNNEEINNKNCQTSFASIKSIHDINKNRTTTKIKHNNSLSLKKEEDSLSLININKKKTSVDYYKNNILNNKNILNSDMKEIKYENNYYNTYYSNKNKKNIIKKLNNNASNNKNNNLEGKIKNSKKTLNISEINSVEPFFTNKTIKGNIYNNKFLKYTFTDNRNNYSSEKINHINSYFFKSHKNRIKKSRLNLLYINTDFLKDKENHLLGKGNNFIGKTIKNYHTKTNVFLPNLSERMKNKLPRYERQENGFILG